MPDEETPLAEALEPEEDDSPRYGLALIAILAAVVASAYSDEQGWVAILSVLTMGIALVFVLQTSGAHARTRRLALAATALGVLGGIVAILVGEQGKPTLYSDFISMLMALVVPFVIVRRLVRRDVIDFQTVAGALCIYLLIGFAFAQVYRNLDDGGAFNGVTTMNALDSIYYSYVTMTTVGYGDITPATDFARLMAISEALIGQLYLVSVVALTVSRVGTSREPPGRLIRRRR